MDFYNDQVVSLFVCVYLPLVTVAVVVVISAIRCKGDGDD